MADITTTWGMDYSGFAAGAAAVERQGARSGRAVESSWLAIGKSAREAAGQLGVGTSAVAAAYGIWGFATSAVDLYYERIGQSGERTKLFNAELDRTKILLGSIWADGMKGTYDFVGNQLRNVRETLAREIPAIKGYLTFREIEYDFKRRARLNELTEPTRLEADSIFLSANRRGFEGSIAAENARNAAARLAIRGTKDLPQDEKDALLEVEQDLHSARMFAIESEEAARREAKGQELNILSLEQDRIDAQYMRMAGMDREAILLDEQIKANQKLYDLAKRTDLTEAEREERVSRIRDNAFSARRAAEESFDREKQLKERRRDDDLKAEAERLAVEGLNLADRPDAARLKAIEFDYAQKIRDVERDTTLKIGEKLDLEAKLAALRDRSLEQTARAIAKNNTREKNELIAGLSVSTIGAGLGSTFTRSAVFGTTATAVAAPESEAQRTLDRLEAGIKASNDILNAIKQNTASGTGATLGP